MSKEVQVIGLCRWSYPSQPGAFQRDAGSLEQITRALYDPLRLRLRLFFLEHVVLPSLRVQTDPDFVLVMLLGQGVPEWAGAEIQDLIADMPQVKAVYAPEGQKHADICRQVMVAQRDPDCRAVAEFRLDDDDAVAVDFVERTRDMFARSRGVFKNGGRLALDFNKGFVLKSEWDGMSLIPVVSRYWTPGLVTYLRPAMQSSLLDYNHAMLWKRMPTLTFPKVPMYLRGAHAGNDSSVSHNPSNMEETWFDPDTLSEVMQDRFSIPWAGLQSAWQEVLLAT